MGFRARWSSVLLTKPGSVFVLPARPVTKQKYGPVGRCIYCGAVDKPLSDEHIIPDGLGGRDILPKSSCAACAKITGRHEQMVMRHAVWPLRQALGMSGKKRKVPSAIPAYGTTPDGGKFSQLREHGAIGVKGALPIFHHLPGFMVGAPLTDQVGADFDVFYDPTIVGGQFDPGVVIELRPEWFARVLAKMAHAQAVAALGYEGFEAFLPPVIIGESQFWPHLVGRASEVPPGPQTNGHWIDLYRQRHPHEGVLLARIRLFAELDGPTYDVVVGRCL